LAIIAQGLGWHIESFIELRVNINNNAIRETTHTLERPGAFLGYNCKVDHDEGLGDSPELAIKLTQDDNSQLLLGDNITTFKSTVLNGSTNIDALGAMILMFIRDH